MNAVPPPFVSAQGAGSASFAERSENPVSRHWAALVEIAEVVAVLAEIEPEPATPDMQNFPALLESADAWRRERAEHGVADLAAVMEPGIAALLSVKDRGADPRAAASALWREFIAARDALLSLVGPNAMSATRSHV
jgi:hypothetical protein